MKWKNDWPQAKRNLKRWWDAKDLAFCLLAPREHPIATLTEPIIPADMEKRWTDPAYRRAKAEWEMAHTWYGGEAVCYFDTQMGPGSLATFLGSRPHFDARTAWYEPCIRDSSKPSRIGFSGEGLRWLDAHLAVVDEGVAHADGRYLVGIPDLIENLDTLSALRGNEALLMDMVERPAWVERAVWQINEAFYTAFELLYERVKDEDQGNVFAAFRIWGPGRTAKVQCDMSCMISEDMFARFVLPALTAQCNWLDYPLYHLDGVGAVRHLDALLSISSLRAIQWQPGSGKLNAGHAHWHGLLRRIKAAGKSIHVGCNEDQVIPLLDALGPEGTYIFCRASSMQQAAQLLERVNTYRTAPVSQDVQS